MNTQDQNIDPVTELTNLLADFEASTEEFEEKNSKLSEEINSGIADLKKDVEEITDNLDAIEEAYS